jgi:hypothetical protein
MKRREVLRLSAGALAAPFLGRTARAQPQQSSAAVVIGVDKPGDFPPLKAAASGARDIGRWLSAEGYSVHQFTDDQGPVRAEALYDTFERLITPPTLDKLVVYFAGHGLYANGTETWLLTGAPTNVQQAINLDECLKLARESGLRNVIFISDACRSSPDSLRNARISGSIVFPNLPPGQRQTRPDIDRFFAALPGRAALETRDAADEYYGIYTSLFMEAFRSSDQDMTKVVDGHRVVPNRLLRKYLKSAVPSRLLTKGVRINQQPDAIIECDDNIYIGRCSDAAAPVSPATQPALPSIGDAARIHLQRFSINTSPFPISDPEKIVGSVAANVLNGVVAAATTAPNPNTPDITTGIVIKGDGSAVAMAEWDVRRVDLPIASDHPIAFHCELRGRPAGTVLIRFSDGSCAPIAVLDGYVANVAFDKGSIVNISYNRSGQGFDDRRIEQLRATVAATTQLGVFRIEGNREQRTQRSREIADRIRVGKSMDPTLGIYAAYAYSDADILDEIRSVRSYTKNDLNIDLFDIAMLSGDFRDSTAAVPFCPMLSQGWNLLRVKGVKLAPVVAEAGVHRRDSLWTIFGAPALGMLYGALRSGQLR